MRTMVQLGTGGASGVDTQLQNQSIRVERKHFTFDLRENPRGRFLRIIEEVNGRRDAIIIPLTGIEEFRDQLNEIIKFSKTLTPKP
jgi:PurA ssDNA and RNA-binding protein